MIPRSLTKIAAGVAVLSNFLLPLAAQQALVEPRAHWPLDEVQNGTVTDRQDRNPGTMSGKPIPATGVVDGALHFNSGSVATDAATIPSSADLNFGATATFSVSAWVRPDQVGNGQMTIVGKVDYQNARREWSLLLDKDKRFRFFVRATDGWHTVESGSLAVASRWQHVAVSVNRGEATLYVNGRREQGASLPASFTPTVAPISIGGVEGQPQMATPPSTIGQPFTGMIDDVKIFGEALEATAVEALANRPRWPLWREGTVPASADLPVLPGVTFSTIKAYEPETDGGYHWRLGVAAAWHDGRLYATFGQNRGNENSPGEEARASVSEDGGRTWGPAHIVQAGDQTLGVSHGVLLSRGDELWAFQGAFYDNFARTHTRVYRLGATEADWIPVDAEIAAGFWPMQEPLKMDDGNWIMSGIHVGRRLEAGSPNLNPPAVAISHGEDLTRWDVVIIPVDNEELGYPVWGESNVLVDGARALNLSRWNASQPFVLVAESNDYGRTWTQAIPSNLPMAASKPATGTLSCGRRYLISNSTSDNGNRRSPLTIALTEPGEWQFSHLFAIRHSEGDGLPDSASSAVFAYPYAIEHEGNLYVGYSNNGNRGGKKNSAELAIIPLAKLREMTTPEDGGTWQTWRARHFTTEELNRDDISGSLADPDGDGLPNLSEYALGGDPFQPDSDVLPAVAIANDRLSLTFTRIADPALLYCVQATDDLGGTAVWTNIWTSTGMANGPGLVTVFDAVALVASSRRFLRLRVQR